MPQGLGGASEVPPGLLSNTEGWLGGGDDHDDVEEEGMYCDCGGHNVLITIFPESLLSTLAFTSAPLCCGGLSCVCEHLTLLHCYIATASQALERFLSPTRLYGIQSTKYKT